MDDLKALVFTAMQNAVDNGHTFMGATYEDIAIDLLDHDSDLEAYEILEVVPYIKEFVWKPEVDKVEAFLKSGDLKAAYERVDMFLPDVQSHICLHLSSEAFDLLEQTK